jgi:hypothetical protein
VVADAEEVFADASLEEALGLGEAVDLCEDLGIGGVESIEEIGEGSALGVDLGAEGFDIAFERGIIELDVALLGRGDIEPAEEGGGLRGGGRDGGGGPDGRQEACRGTARTEEGETEQFH